MNALPELSQQEIDLIIGMAWADHVTFEEIEEKTGLSEYDVIRLMRRELTPSCYRVWRQRIGDRLTQYRRLFQTLPETSILVSKVD